jgi:hypothetical protein
MLSGYRTGAPTVLMNVFSKFLHMFSRAQPAQRDKTPGIEMDTYTSVQEISNLLHEVAEIHHRVFRIVDGADDDWASWYADWLINLSELPVLLKVKPVRSELVYMLVGLDKQYTADSPAEPWESYYASRLLDHFRPATG